MKYWLVEVGKNIQQFVKGSQKAKQTPPHHHLKKPWLIHSLADNETIRLAFMELEDFPFLVASQQASCPENPGIDANHLKAELAHNPNAVHLKALINDQIIGYLTAQINSDTCHLTNLFVLSEYRSLGCGRLLVQQLKEYALKQKVSSMTLEVRFSNRLARQFYEKLGFKEQDVLKKHYSLDGEDALVMVKRLPVKSNYPGNWRHIEKKAEIRLLDDPQYAKDLLILTHSAYEASPNWSLNTFIEDINYQHSRYYGYFENQDLLGYVACQVVLDEATITNIAVNPFCQRGGIGRYLMRYVQEELCRQGVKKIFLEVRASNHSAVHFYEKMNFKQISVRKKYYINPVEDALILVHKLV